jgi:diguanylate cyclase (GGDEF)-like protein
MLDLDYFKAVNDSLGHSAGDELLQQVAERISKQLRKVDTVARLGGDEFVVLLTSLLQQQDIIRVTSVIINELHRPFLLRQTDSVQIGTSIGISFYPQHGDTLEVLMDVADSALYKAKKQGRGCFCIAD